MNDIFEHRVGEVLARIAQRETRFWWRGDHRSSRNESRLGKERAEQKDLRLRVRPAKRVHRPSTPTIGTSHASSPSELRRVPIRTKRFEHVRRHRIRTVEIDDHAAPVKRVDRNGVHIDDMTKFIPLMVAQNAGTPANAFTEMLVMVLSVARQATRKQGHRHMTGSLATYSVPPFLVNCHSRWRLAI
ncbi:hypothetical protein [Mycobacterium sp. NPDC050041]|uniref:hypothetical protein n=1 Tax=Mycobacterium sp. NPDC050041 TaxID=3364293 RepID=UPI003C2D0D2A